MLKLDTLTEASPPAVNGEVPATNGPVPVSAENEEAAKEARRIAKRIINDTAKLDPNRVPQDTGRSRRKVSLLPVVSVYTMFERYRHFV